MTAKSLVVHAQPQRAVRRPGPRGARDHPHLLALGVARRRSPRRSAGSSGDLRADGGSTSRSTITAVPCTSAGHITWVSSSSRGSSSAGRSSCSMGVRLPVRSAAGSTPIDVGQARLVGQQVRGGDQREEPGRLVPPALRGVLLDLENGAAQRRGRQPSASRASRAARLGRGLVGGSGRSVTRGTSVGRRKGLSGRSCSASTALLMVVGADQRGCPVARGRASSARAVVRRHEEDLGAGLLGAGDLLADRRRSGPTAPSGAMVPVPAMTSPPVSEPGVRVS